MALFALTLDTTSTTHRVTSKNSKKKNEAPLVCTWRNFAGSSKYLNCQKIETKINIGCGDEDVDDTTRMCKVTEHPWNNEQKGGDTVAAAATTACVVYGLFDPKTHITTDSATGLCHLKFLPLLDSCDVDVDANCSPSGLFGVKAEIHNSRNTENHNDDNSGMLLRFSHTGGEDFYNDDNPRETVPLHDVIPAERKLEEDDCKFYTCETPVGSFGGLSCDNDHSNNSRDGCVDKTGDFKSKYWWFKKTGMSAFETCFGFGSPDGTRCWSKSHYVSGWSWGWYPCVPRDRIVEGNTYVHWYVTQPLSDGSCGEPCGDHGFNQGNVEPFHCTFCNHYISPNWCDLLVDDCPGKDVPICASECKNHLYREDCSYNQQLCFSFEKEICYCHDN